MNIGLLSQSTYVATPFISVTIGDYKFGIIEKVSGLEVQGKVYKENRITYPNYIKSLDITKINGQVNTYTLKLEYTITERNDPNFFEKVFASVSDSRKIVFSYGDYSAPTYMYKDEEAIILNVKSDFAIASSKISYTVSAVSTGILSNVGVYSFDARDDKPSNVIRELLYTESYGLLDIFPGMRNRRKVEDLGLIPSNDVRVHLEAKTNISVFNYLTYLIDSMTSSNDNALDKDNLYVLIINDDTSGIVDGTYFKIEQIDRRIEHSEAYDLDIGFPSRNAVIDFHIENDESYAIYYKYQKLLNDEQYVQRISPSGDIIEDYAPILSSGTPEYETHENQKSWWSKVTEYPVKSSITIRGLLRPAILMSYVRLNVFFFGKKHISSGLYIVTKEQDSISESGFKTTLNLIRIAKDDEFIGDTEGLNAMVVNTYSANYDKFE